MLGSVLQATSEGEEAAKAFGRALELVDDNGEKRMEYALCLYRIGKEEEAIAQCDMLLATDEDNFQAKGLRGMLLGLRRGGLRIDPVSHQLSPASPLSITPGHEHYTPVQKGLDLIERYGILNHRVDKLDPDMAQLLSSIFCGLGDLYNGTFYTAARNIALALGLLSIALILLYANPTIEVDVYRFSRTTVIRNSFSKHGQNICTKKSL